MTSRPPFLDAATPELARWFPKPDRAAWRAAAERTRVDPDLAVVVAPGVITHPLAPAGPAPDPGPLEAAPFTRGAGGLDRRAVGWDIRQLHDAGTLQEAARVIGVDLARGGRSVWLVPDGLGRGLPASAEGLPLHTAGDLSALLKGVDLPAHPIHLEAGARADDWLDALLGLWEAAGVGPALRTGAVTTDLAGTLATVGVWPESLPSTWDRLAARIARCRTAAPSLHLAGVSGLPWAEAGATGALELGLILAGLAETLRELDARGHAPESVLPHLLVTVSVGRATFHEISKLRALRTAISRLLEDCGVPAAQRRVFVHAVTPRSQLAARDPWTNLLRTTQGAFSAALGAADAITLVPHDRALGAPDDLARRVASNTQVVLGAEAHLSRVLDPAGGAHHLEALTQGLAAAGWEVLGRVEAAGGLLRALQQGGVQGWLQEASADAVQRSSTGEDIWIGVNRFVRSEAPLERAVVGCQAADVAVRVQVAPVPRVRPARPWEGLQAAVAQLGAARGEPVTVGLLALGPPGEHRGAVAAAKALLGSAGLVTRLGDEGADLVCLCGSAEAVVARAAELGRADLLAAGPAAPIPGIRTLLKLGHTTSVQLAEIVSSLGVSS